MNIYLRAAPLVCLCLVQVQEETVSYTRLSFERTMPLVLAKYLPPESRTTIECLLAWSRNPTASIVH